MVAPDSQATACPPSGRNSTYRPVQISETSSNRPPKTWPPPSRFTDALRVNLRTSNDQMKLVASSISRRVVPARRVQLVHLGRVTRYDRRNDRFEHEASDFVRSLLV